jgi:hypothetical protein
MTAAALLLTAASPCENKGERDEDNAYDRYEYERG